MFYALPIDAFQAVTALLPGQVLPLDLHIQEENDNLAVDKPMPGTTTMTCSQLIVFLLWIFLAACTQMGSPNLYKAQTELSEKTGIELLVIVNAEQITQTKATRLKTWLSTNAFLDDVPKYKISQPNVKGKTVELPGVSFLIPKEERYKLVDSINQVFNYRGHYAFISDDEYREDKKITLSIVRGGSVYNVLSLQQTNGINFGISTDSLINALKAFSVNYPFTIIGADFDWCELRLEKQPADWLELSKEVLKLCPTDEVTPEQFADALKAEKGTIFLWWD